MITMTTRRCSLCQKDLPLTSFGRNCYSPSGYRSRCKRCGPLRQTKTQKPCLECKRVFEFPLAQKNRIFCSNSCALAFSNKARVTRPGLHKELQEVAQHAVEAFVRRVKPGQQICVNCESTKFVEAHHEDYSYPLRVCWLCHRCHSRHHRGEQITIVEVDLGAAT